jgi:protein-tyrosine phosphatase
MDDPRRLLDFPGLLNARDLGGYPTLDGARTRFRSLLRADDLVQLTPAGISALASFGVETVVDLRWPEEVAASPSPLPRELAGVSYRQVSLLSGSSAAWLERTGDCPKELFKCLVLEHAREELLRVLQIIAAADPGPLLFHCVAGKDRTGVIAALLLAAADVEPSAIAYDYAASTERLREAYLHRYAKVGSAEILEAVRCPEEGVHNMLAHLNERGGVHAYLLDIGLTPDEIARLRARLR